MLSTPHRRTCLLLCSAIIMAAPLLGQQSGDAAGGGASSTLPLSSSSQRSTPGSSGTAGSSLTAVPEDFSDLKLAPGFLLDVQVYDDPQLSTQVRVDKEGNISMPFIGNVHVSGETVAVAQHTIQDRLQEAEILTNPQVTVNVQQYTASNVTVLGEVQAPGRLQLLAAHPLLDVLGMAGGETNLAGDTIEIKHPGSSGPVSSSYKYARNSPGNSIRDVMVNPGDTVVVERAGIVYVFGAVNRPGGYVMQEDGSLNVAQAISLALGTTLQAKVGDLRVVRRSADGRVQDIPVSYKDISDGKEKPLQLEAEDIVYVPVSKVKSIFTAGSTIIGQTASASIYAVK